MRNGRTIAPIALAALLLFEIASTASATGENSAEDLSEPAAVAWTCWAARTRIQCELDRATTATDPLLALPEEPAEPLVSATVGTRPRGRELPPIANQLRRHPERFAGHRISIPAFGEPRNPLGAEELATSVICSGRADCRVTFLRTPAEVALYQDAHGDPALH